MIEPGSNPPRNGEGDQPQAGGGGPAVLASPIGTVKRARRLRREMSLPEILLWRELRRQPGGFKFRRQFPQDRYVLDFACLGARLGIEIDGEVHDRGDRPQRDGIRDELLNKLGFRMLRIPAREVLRNLEGVLAGIVEQCRALSPLHHPAAQGGPPPRSGEDL
ncbi:MAG TPA: endonuclease domain-containing protein [Allosphingosinicella sp.]|nr:endonuclease domain-containing protein [Allosphingosinicella sp.]